MSKPTAEIRRFWDQVVALGCQVTGAKHGVTIHHVHGGSVADRGFKRTFGRKTSDRLVIGLHESLHTGPGGIDGFPRPSVREWEAKHGKQADMVDRVGEALGMDLWALARAEEKGMVPRRAA
jgi:hypothetical protein